MVPTEEVDPQISVDTNVNASLAPNETIGDAFIQLSIEEVEIIDNSVPSLDEDLKIVEGELQIL